MLDAFLDTMLPRQCCLCRAMASTAVVCPACAAALEGITTPEACPWCALPSEERPCRDCLESRPPFRRVLVLGELDGLLERAVLVAKQGKWPQLSAHLGALLARRVEAAFPRPELVVPVPSEPGRSRRRGLSPAHPIALGLASELGLPLGAEVLVRRAGDGILAGLGRSARRLSVAGSFRSGRSAELAHARRVLLVDDVKTTGATLAEASRELLGESVGAREVWAAAVAGPRRGVAPPKRLGYDQE